MNRDEAVTSLKLIRSVIEKTRDEAILQNWGWIFALAGLLKLAGCAVSNYWIVEGETSPRQFLLLWIGYVAALLLIILALRKKSPGVRTFVEKSIWGIWIAYIVACFMVAAMNALLELPPFVLLPVCALIAAFGWTMMALTVARVFALFVVIFLATAYGMTLFPTYGFLILGGGWFVSLEAAAVHCFLLRRRMKTDDPARLL